MIQKDVFTHIHQKKKRKGLKKKENGDGILDPKPKHFFLSFMN